MIGSQLLPVLARRIEMAVQQQGHRSSGGEVEGFALVLEDLTAVAQPVEEDGCEDDREKAPLPKTESEARPEAMNPGSVTLSPPHEGTAQCGFLRPASMPLSLTGVIMNSAERPAPPEEAEPKAYAELPVGQFHKSDGGESPPVLMSRDAERVFIQLTEGEGANQSGKAAAPALPHQEESSAATEVAFTLVRVQEAEVIPYPSPAIQIMAAINAEAPHSGSPSGMPSAPQPAQFSSPELPSPSDVKALRLKLQPEELGEVEVTIRRVGLQTKVTITVAGKASADAVSKDKSILEERLSNLFNPGTGSALSFNMEIRDASAGQEQSPMASGGEGFSGTALPDSRGSSREDRPDRQHQPLMRAEDERESENRDVSPASGGDRIV